MTTDLCACSSCERLAHEPMALRAPRSMYHRRLDADAARTQAFERAFLEEQNRR